jgi:F0F1-type ATP synthase membrane subunit b/b'
VSDAAGSQLAAAQSRVEQLQEQLNEKEQQLKGAKVRCTLLVC